MAIPSILLVVERVRTSIYGIPTACGLGMTWIFEHGCSNLRILYKAAITVGLDKSPFMY